MHGTYACLEFSSKYALLPFKPEGHQRSVPADAQCETGHACSKLQQNGPISLILLRLKTAWLAALSLMVGLQTNIARPAKPMITAAQLAPVGETVGGAVIPMNGESTCPEF